MRNQSVRQEARRAATEARAVLRNERVARERRLANLAVDALSALGERDLAVAKGERRAGEAINEMTSEEGLTLREVIGWLGNDISQAEAGRLRRRVRSPQVAHPTPTSTDADRNGVSRSTSG